jgi:hypothetical protein
MRRPALLRRPRKTKLSTQQSIPAPVGGWNARDPIASMDPADAILLDNFFPSTSDVMLRKGADDHVTGISGQVESLMPYNDASGAQTLFGAAGTAFYNVTSSGAVGAAVQSSLTNARWQSINFATTAGQFLMAANGADNIRRWDGSTWVTITAASTGAITGVDTDDIIHLAVHKNRVWLIEKNTLSAWYLPTDAIAGAATEFALNGVAKNGGMLMAVEGWTIDGGDGVDDYWIAVTSEGELIAYKGTDVSSASTWALHGVWNVGQPIGRRCFLRVGGELLLITKGGVLPVSKVLLSKVVDAKSAITDKIAKAMTDAVSSYGANFGWQLLDYPGGPMVLLNVPVSEGSSQHQYVMNRDTGKWCRFKGIEANCWAILDGEPYFGGNGVVGKLWGSYDDNSDNIDGDMKQAFNYFGQRGLIKEFKDARPIFASDGSPSILAALNFDYSDDEPSGSLSFTPTSYALWDTAVWDTGVWGGGLSPFAEWQGTGGVGTCAALRMKVAAAGIEVRHQATDFLFEVGTGVIG